MSNVTKKQIKELEKAIKKDLAEKRRANYNVKKIEKLQEYEKDISETIEKLEIKRDSIQKKIVEKLELEFDYCDDLSMKAFKDTLKKFKKAK